MAFKPPREEDYPQGFLYVLGHIIALWSNLEQEVRHTLYTLSDIEGRDALLILGHTDLRARIAALKAVAFRKMEPKDFARCEQWLSIIGTDFRNYRNRLVHDAWRPVSEDIALGIPFAQRWNPAAKVINTPPSGEKALQLGSVEPVGIDELKLFVQDLQDAWIFVANMPQYSRERGFPAGLPQPSLRHKSPPPYPRSSPGFDQRTYKPGDPPQS